METPVLVVAFIASATAEDIAATTSGLKETEIDIPFELELVPGAATDCVVSFTYIHNTLFGLAG